MANLPVTVTIGNPDPSWVPTTFTQMVVYLRLLITAVVTGTYVPYVQGSATPAVDDQDKVWHKTDGDGRPWGTFKFYNGAWRRQYSGNQNELVYYQGDPADHFEASGKGKEDTDWDGWYLCNGQNGTFDLSDKFIVVGKVNDLTIGFSNGWKTAVSGATTASGGQKDITLDAANTYRPAKVAVTVSKWEADGNTLNPAAGLYGQGSNIDLVAADTGNETPSAIPTLPPYYALAMAVFLGYD